MQAIQRFEPPAPTGTTPCLLVVDDQEFNIRVVGSALVKLGLEILPATSGAQALKRMTVRRPSLILLDLLMPDMDGFEVCRRISQNPAWAEIPIIFLSAADDKGLIVRALESGGVDYVTKPFDMAELTSRVRTHLALKTARDRLQQLAEDKDELIGILAHDLKNHLGGMQLSAQLLNEGGAVTDPKLRQLGENILHSTDQMLGFLKEFLANAATEHGLSINLQPVPLATAALRAVEQYQEAARRKEIVLGVQTPSAGTEVWADGAALDQVLGNILSNAVKFTPPGRRIDVTVRAAAGGWVECLIHDQGPGFKEEDKARMFRRYGRLSARPTGGEPSTGLGLSIVKPLMQAMRGGLTCESTPGDGATFILRLPRLAQP